FRGGTAVQSEVAFVFSVATQAGDILRDPRGVVKIVALVAITAGTVHGCRCERGMPGKAGEVE
ncbi:MAG: hypothetical protein ACXW3Z_09710, partial [Limisphaerales bacterium]